MNGEYGATPLHYAARYTFKPSRTPGVTPLETPSASPMSRKSNRGLKSLISSRRPSAVRKEDLPKRPKGGGGGVGSSPFQRSLRSLLGRALIGNKKSSEIPHAQTQQTIHKSLEQIETSLLMPSSQTGLSQTQSNLELQSLFKKNPKVSASSVNSLCSSKPSLDLKISETPVVIFGDSSVKDSDDVLSINALIIPEIKHFNSCDETATSMKASRSLPDIGDEMSGGNLKDVGAATEANVGFEGNRTSPIETSNATRFKVVSLLDVPETRRLKEESILIYLLEQKANVNAKDFYGSTPLHFASMRGNVIAARHLLNVKSIDIEVCPLLHFYMNY